MGSAYTFGGLKILPIILGSEFLNKVYRGEQFSVEMVDLGL